MREPDSHVEKVMTQRRSLLTSLAFSVLAFIGLPAVQARPPSGRGPGRRRGGSAAPDWQADHATIRTLLTNRDKIRRKVKLLPNGVETLTETDDPQLRKTLVQHVHSMKQRVEDVRPIHLRDPLFAALFRHANKIKAMNVTTTKSGVRVVETSDNRFTVKLIQAHAKVVTLFIKHGHEEVRKNHSVPNQPLD